MYAWDQVCLAIRVLLRVRRVGRDMLVGLLQDHSIMNTTVRRGAVVASWCFPSHAEVRGLPRQLEQVSPHPFRRRLRRLATDFPPLSGPSRTFIFDRELSYRVSDYTKKSRFVLYDNGAFVLQYPSLGEGGYRGGYEDANGVITFEWEGWSVGGPWGATGTLEGDSLTVQYNLIMQMTDFEDAVYVLMP